MILSSRQEEILQCVRSGSGTRLAELCERFGVSAATMRRDLALLEKRGLLRRVRGGALPPGAEVRLPEPAAREREHWEEKRRIGAAAAAMVADGSVVMIDAGTTTRQMLPHLANKQNLTVITRDLQIAFPLAAFPQITVICIGGTLHRDHAVAGSLALRFLEQFSADQIFLGALGVTPDGGIWTANGEEALIKLESMNRSRQRILLADSSKIGRAVGTLVSPIPPETVLITDQGLSAQAEAEFHRMGVSVHRV